MIVSNDAIINDMKPPYEISHEILELYGQINNLLGQCKSLHLVKPEARLRKQNRIKTIHSSLAIEGNTLDIEHVTAILEKTIVVGPQGEILEVQNAIKAYELLNSFNSISLKDFKKAHKVLMNELVKSPGSFRAKQVGVMNGSSVQHVAPKHQMVGGLMDDLFEYLKNNNDLSIIKSCVFHYEVEFIHPFEDGNGRMGRLWQTRLLMDVNPIFEYVPIEEGIRRNQEKYYKSLALSDKSGKSTKFIEFMLQIIQESLQKTIEESAVPNFDFIARLDLARSELKDWFDRKEYMNLCKGISTATASRDLKQMVEEGQVKVRGSGRMTQYFFSS